MSEHFQIKPSQYWAATAAGFSPDLNKFTLVEFHCYVLTDAWLEAETVKFRIAYPEPGVRSPFESIAESVLKASTPKELAQLRKRVVRQQQVDEAEFDAEQAVTVQ
jgi:hypothetical protein